MERKDTTIGLHLWHNSLKNKESDDGKPEQTDNLTKNITTSKSLFKFCSAFFCGVFSRIFPCCREERSGLRDEAATGKETEKRLKRS